MLQWPKADLWPHSAKRRASIAAFIVQLAPLQQGSDGVNSLHRGAHMCGFKQVPGHLAAAVAGEGFAHGRGYCLEFVAEGLQHMRHCRWVKGVRELDQHHQARRALDQRTWAAGVPQRQNDCLQGAFGCMLEPASPAAQRRVLVGAKPKNCADGCVSGST